MKEEMEVYNEVELGDLMDLTDAAGVELMCDNKVKHSCCFSLAQQKLYVFRQVPCPALNSRASPVNLRARLAALELIWDLGFCSAMAAMRFHHFE